MAKISFVLVFSLVVALPLRSSVLGQEDGWKSFIGDGGFTPGDIEGAAAKVLGEGSLSLGGDASSGGASEEAEYGAVSLEEWIDTPPGDAGGASSPVGTPEAPAADAKDDSSAGPPPKASLKKSPKGAPQISPARAPQGSQARAPQSSQARAPQGSEVPTIATPTKAPKLAPNSAATEAPIGGVGIPPSWGSVLPPTTHVTAPAGQPLKGVAIDPKLAPKQSAVSPAA